MRSDRSREVEVRSDRGDVEARRPSGRARWFMPVLVAVYASNFVDRTIVNVLQQPIKVELGLRDWQLGLLGGTSFAVFYSVLGLYVARLAERGNRIRLLTTCVVLWSVFTALCGFVGAFWQLLALRIGVAVGEAGATPTGHSLIADRYPPARRPGAIAVFATGNTIGNIIGAVIGGFVGQAVGWRWAFIVAGAPGLLLAALTFLVLRDPRGEAAVRPPVPPLSDAARTLFISGSFRWIATGTSLNLFAAYAVLGFTPPHLMRSLGYSLKAASLYAGVGGGVALAAGTLLGGWLTQRLATRDRRWMLWLPAITLLGAGPLCAIAFTSLSAPLVVGGFLATCFCFATFQGPVYSTTLSLVEVRMRATASALLLLVSTMVGLGLGPLMLGFVSDHFAASAYGPGFDGACRAAARLPRACEVASATGLRQALASTSVIFVLAGAAYLMVARTIRRDVLD